MKSLQASKIYISCFVFLHNVQSITAQSCEILNSTDWRKFAVGNRNCTSNTNPLTLNLGKAFYIDQVRVISKGNIDVYVSNTSDGDGINKSECNKTDGRNWANWVNSANSANWANSAYFHCGVTRQHVEVEGEKNNILHLCSVIIMGGVGKCSSAQTTTPKQTTESTTLVPWRTTSISTTTLRSSAKTTTDQSTTRTTMQLVTTIAQKTTTQQTTTESQGTTSTGQKTTSPMLLSIISAQGTTRSTHESHKIPRTKEEAKQKVKELREELTVDKKKTNIHYRKLISAPDDRPSSQTMGWFGAIIISLPILLCIVMDLTRRRSVGKKKSKRSKKRK